MFGDFEDLESGEKFAGGDDESSEDDRDGEAVQSEPEKEEDEKTKKHKLWEKKMKLKQAFNQEYDDKDWIFIFISLNDLYRVKNNVSYNVSINVSYKIAN